MNWESSQRFGAAVKKHDNRNRSYFFVRSEVGGFNFHADFARRHLLWASLNAF